MKITPSIQEYFSNKNLEIPLFPSTRTRKFSKIELFLAFIKKEKTFWEECKTGRLNNIRQHFNNIYNLIEGSYSDESQTLQSLQEAINLARIGRIPCVYSEASEAKLLKGIYKKSSNQADSAYDYLFRNTINVSNCDSFLGIMYAFNQKDRGKVLERITEAEKESLAELKNTYTNQLNKLSEEFFSHSDQIKVEFDTIQKNLSDGQEHFRSDTQSILNDSKQRIKELENLYEEKLRLQSPAKYWNDMRTEYTKKGQMWRLCSIVTSLFFVIFLSCILYNAPQSLFEQFDFKSLKATIVFALITSIGIYLIRFFVLLSTSAYHLSRDAYERYQLTHVYLSLLNSKAISESERGIVLQSLFSRADTGLLKGDSSPTFPNSVLDQLLKNVNK